MGDCPIVGDGLTIWTCDRPIICVACCCFDPRVHDGAALALRVRVGAIVVRRVARFVKRALARCRAAVGQRGRRTARTGPGGIVVGAIGGLHALTASGRIPGRRARRASRLAIDRILECTGPAAGRGVAAGRVAGFLDRPRWGSGLRGRGKRECREENHGTGGESF